MNQEQWINDQHDDLVQRLSAGAERKIVQQDVAKRLQELFPDADEAKGLAHVAVLRALQAIKGGGTTTTIIINNSFNGSDPAPAQSEPPDRKPKKPSKPKTRKLNFRLIRDGSLKLLDRIVYSLLWKWAWMNRKPKRFAAKPVTVKRLRRATGSRANTIKASLARLRDKGYIDERHEPYPKHASLMKDTQGRCIYRKLTWEAETGGGINQSVYQSFREYDVAKGRRAGAAYYTGVLGISIATYIRYERARRRGNI